ncbi:unnamed protein product [Danaus chrysippus]|uniref:(African queen) hypothetical protein n=1 Tax=Danaus chrysippus TaxID=151541 RepID=A0A8J2R7S5_9NEOP|nr:unnamed protein product [Danaus chrysippus]
MRPACWLHFGTTDTGEHLGTQLNTGQNKCGQRRLSTGTDSASPWSIPCSPPPPRDLEPPPPYSCLTPCRTLPPSLYNRLACVRRL